MAGLKDQENLLFFYYSSFLPVERDCMRRGSTDYVAFTMLTYGDFSEGIMVLY